ncbi:hypothetical protein [Clostridium akagii]|uniref:hypothetical protein n=1 Tax=Clostridium akagii TaxID=91623 RepID=UPI00047EDD5A|nr:hypothetical protein [Clostridium akagii]
MPTHKKHHHIVKEPESNNNNNPFDFNLDSIAKLLGKVNLLDMVPVLEKMGSREAEGNNKSKADIINAIKILLDSDKGELVAVLIEAYGMSRLSIKK